MVAALGSAGCAAGTTAADVRPPPKNKDAAAPAPHDDGGTKTDGSTDSSVGDASACDLTVCGGLCVDTSSDANNCGSCFNVCGVGTTCVAGLCQTQSTTSHAPPQGSCAHDLCAASLGYLTPGCDPSGCVANVCNTDSFCCDSSSGNWDTACVGEVATYCSPYSCP